MHSSSQRRMKPRQFVKLLRLACDKGSSARDRDWAMSQMKGHREEFRFQDLASVINETALDNSRRLKATMKKTLAGLYGRTPNRMILPKAEAMGTPARKQTLSRGRDGRIVVPLPGARVDAL